MAKSYYNIIETLVSIYAVDGDTLKILLKQKKNEPYQNYWLLPGDVLSTEDTLEECASKVVLRATNLPSIYLEEGLTFSNLDRDPEERIIAATFMALTVKEFVRNTVLEWFDIDELPKMAYDHGQIARDNIKKIKSKIIRNENDVLFSIFPNDFTLSELQHFFEKILGKELDRRNFRKKLISENIVVETGGMARTNGRPSKLYKFNRGGHFHE